jgi:hypothetical protein
MLKLKRPAPSSFGQFVLVAIVGAALFGMCVLAAKHPWIVIPAIAAIALWSWYDSRARARRLLALAKGRTGQDICEFAREFDPRKVDTWVVRAVYEQLQEYLVDVHPKFPVRADDVLIKNLVSDPDDLDISPVEEIAERTGRSLDGASANPHYQGIRTVRDLVMFFNAQPRASAA